MPKSTGTIENGPQNRGARSEDRTEESLQPLDTDKVKLLQHLRSSLGASSDPWRELSVWSPPETLVWETFSSNFQPTETVAPRTVTRTRKSSVLDALESGKGK